MSGRLELYSLGQLAVMRGRVPVSDLASSKAYALLIYVAINRRSFKRAYLAELFWPNREPQRSLANLRVVLSSIRQQLSPHVSITNQAVSLDQQQDYWLDAHELENQITQSRKQWNKTRQLSQDKATQLMQAIELYKGPFLDGFHIPDSPEFERWVHEYRHQLEEWVIEALDTLVNFHIENGQYHSGLQQGKRLLQLNQLREETYRKLMLLYALSNNRDKAIECFETCRSILQEQLGIKPNQAIIETYEQIIHDSIAPKVLPVNQYQSLSSNLSNLVGRKEELEEIINEIQSPDCRLLTLTGPGGIGKTRLALEVVRTSTFFADGVYFIPLYSLNVLDYLAHTIAETLHYVFKDKGNAKSLLINYLAKKDILLVLDNFDHLIEGGAEFVSDLLSKTTETVKILITSRECLNLKQETALNIKPLDFPEKVDEDFDEYSSVKLFIDRVRFSQSEYAKSQMNRVAILQICRTVTGNPLGIELAATMTRYVSLSGIAEEIQRNLDFLTSSRRDISDGHQSLRAVFEHSWKFLSNEEKSAFKRLSVFPSSFSREAAIHITNTSLPVLSTLVDKSLIRRNTYGRFQMHQLLRQYAQEKLSLAGEFPSLKKKHCQFYSRFLEKMEPLLTGLDRLEILEQIKAEIENIRIAWQWMTELNLKDEVEKSLNALWHFFEAHSWFTEALSQFSHAADIFNSRSEENVLSGRLLRCEGWFHFKTGKLAKAEELLKLSLDIGRNCELASDVCFSLTLLGFFYNSIGESDVAKEYCQESLAVAKELGNKWSITLSLNVLGNIARRAGDYSEAKQLCQESLKIAENNGDRTAMAICLNDLGQLALLMGDYENAEQLCDQSLVVSESVSDRLGVAISFARLGMIAQARGDFDTAQDMYNWSLQHSKSIDDRVGVALSLNRASSILCLQGKYQLANDYCKEALTLSRKMGNKRGIIFSLNCSGRAAFFEKKLNISSSFFEEGLQLARATNNWQQAAIALIGLADIAWLQKDISSCKVLSIDSVEVATIANVPHLVLGALLQIARPLFIEENLEQAFFILRLVQTHPMSWHETQEAAKSLQIELASSLHPDTKKRAQYDGETKFLHTFANHIINLLS